MKVLATGNLKAGYDSVRSAKLRSFWTMLGVIIGVASVILIVGIGEGIKQQISGQIHHLGANVITIKPSEVQTGNSSGVKVLSSLSVSGSLTTKDIAVVRQTSGVSASAPLTLVGGTASGVHGAYHDGYVVGTSPDLAGLLNQSIAFGSFLSDDDSGLNMAVLGPHAAEALFDEDVPLGRSFIFHGQQFIVRGIFNQFNTSPLSQQVDFNNTVFIPEDVAQQLTKGTAPTYEILAKTTKSSQTGSVSGRISKSLDAAHGGQSNFSILQGNQNVTASNDVLELLTRMIAGVAAISLLVGGIGIMNVMQVSVAERMHEIGIRKSVGATNRQILNQFMVESSLLSLLGGIIGIVLAFAADGLLRLLTALRPAISWQLVVLATGVSLVVGVVFGTAPAFKAARKDPIDALRSE